MNIKKETRRQVRERLKRNLESLESYCKPGVIPPDYYARNGWATEIFHSDKLGYWPSYDLLTEVKDDVLRFAFLDRDRKNPFLPVWEAFEHVEKRGMKNLQPESCVNDLIRHALDMLPRESELGRAVREARMAGNAQAKCTLRDMLLNPKKMSELLGDDSRYVIQKCMARPLACWLMEIMHPKAKDFNNIVELFPTAEEMKAERRHEKKLKAGRIRKQRYDLRKKIRQNSVTSA